MENISQFIKHVSSKYPNKNLFNDLTYKESYKLIKQRAAFLQKKGIGKGSVVAILAISSPEWCITHISICITGASVLALDGNLPTSTHLKMMHNVGVKYVFVSEEFNTTFNKIKSLDISMSENVIDENLYRDCPLTSEDVAALLYTSGTTAEPKIVQLTHGNIVKTSIAASAHLQVVYNDTLLAVLPLYHVYALIANIYAPMLEGCSMVYQPSLKGPDIIKSLKENGITIFPAVPQLWELFFDSIANKVKNESKHKYKVFMFMVMHGNKLRKLGLGFLVNKIFAPIHSIFGKDMRFLLSGGASLKEQYHKYYVNMGFKVVIGYGLTETTGPIAASTITQTKPGFTGKAIPGNEIKIKNTNKDGIGEIWLKGMAVMPGYYKNEKANREVFDNDGWFNSGDIGLIDKYGDLRITGREKNIIVLDSGKNVYPEELEAYYQNSELITELAVFGMKENDRDIVFAVIVPVNKTKKAYSEIKQEIQSMNKDLPTYMIISKFALSFESLPRTSSKKVIIREIEKKLQLGEYQSSETDKTFENKEIAANSPKEEHIINVLKLKLKKDQLLITDSLVDFNIDSLGKIDLIVHLEEQLNIEVNPEIFAGKNEINELILYLSNCTEKRDGSISDKILKSKIQTKPISLYNPILEILLLLIKYISKFVWHLQIINKQNLKINNSILVSNHQSNIDALWILSLIPRKDRKQLFVIGKKEVIFLKYLFPGIQTIFVERKGDILPALKAGSDVLRQGKSLLIFPEGTRTLNGALLSFKTGAAYLSMGLNKKILPITINGSFEILPKKKLVPKIISKKGGSITVHSLIDPQKYKTIESLNNKIKEVIKSALNY